MPKTKMPKRIWAKILQKYKMTEYAFKKMAISQNLACKLCLIPDDISPLHVDHCHRNGKIRGLLCNNCNVMLGLAKENPVTLLRGIQYLKGNL